MRHLLKVAALSASLLVGALGMALLAVALAVLRRGS